MSAPSNQITPESDLIEGCKQGNPKMQQELYERFAPKMFAVCMRYAGNAEEAQDILQDGFVKLFRKIDSFRNEGSFEGWVRRIFVNTAIEQVRKRTFLQPITEHEENTLEGKYLSVLDNLAERDIIELIQKLPPGYRTVFNMYVIEGYNHREIAEALGITEGTSKSQLSRARLILQDLVRKHIEKRKQVP